MDPQIADSPWRIHADQGSPCFASLRPATARPRLCVALLRNPRSRNDETQRRGDAKQGGIQKRIPFCVFRASCGCSLRFRDRALGTEKGLNLELTNSGTEGMAWAVALCAFQICRLHCVLLSGIRAESRIHEGADGRGSKSPRSASPVRQAKPDRSCDLKGGGHVSCPYGM